MSVISEGVINPRARYPPVVEMIKTLGYIRDRNGIGYSRDIGRSSCFAGRLYYFFGDTFCKNAEGLFVGVSDNTVALIPDPGYPLQTEYLSIQEDGLVKTLLRLTDHERSLKEAGMRVVLWGFGGIVETSQGVGWIWYQKALIDSHSLQHYQGTGLARVSVGGPDGQLSAFRCEDLIFEAGEPRIGTFSSLIEGEFVYLWGDHGGGVILARVSKFSPTSRNAYRYWNGRNYTKDWREAVHVLKQMQHGSFFKSKLFGSERAWVFVGCTSCADSIVMLGAEANLEGPWTLTPLFQAPGINQPNQFRYCMYGHSWGLEADKGELLVTWSESWPGGVIGAKVQLAMGKSVPQSSLCTCSLI